MTQNKERIVVCGHYGSTNIGDFAIGLSMLQNLQRVKPQSEITFLSYNPENTKKFLHNRANYLLPLGVRSLIRGIFKGEIKKTLKVIKECDKFILGGGGLFTDEKIFAVFLWGFHAFVALKYKKPLYMIGQSVGPLNTKLGRWIIKKCFSKARMIVVRDTKSKETLNELGVKNEILIGPDIVFGLEFEEKDYFNEELNKKIEQNNLKGYFMVSIRPWLKNSEKLNKNLDHILNQIVEKHRLLPVLIPFQQINQNDEQLMHKIFDQSVQKYPFLIQKFTQDLSQVISLIRKSQFTIGMRLHSLIFSILLNVPFIAISYSPKVKNLINDIHLSKFIVNLSNLNDIMPKLPELNRDNESIKQKEKEASSKFRNDIVTIFSKI